MFSRVLGIDIETDTSPLTQAELSAGFTQRGLAPQVSSVTAVAIAHEFGSCVFTAEAFGGELPLLEHVDAWLRECDPSLLVSWNGAVFDLPFLRFRFDAWGLSSAGPRLRLDRAIRPKYAPVPPFEGGYAASWPTAVDVPHAHFDVAYALQPLVQQYQVPWQLKPVARWFGFSPVEVDRSRLHELSRDELVSYVASDAAVTRQLALAVLDPGLSPAAAGLVAVPFPRRRRPGRR